MYECEEWEGTFFTPHQKAKIANTHEYSCGFHACSVALVFLSLSKVHEEAKKRAELMNKHFQKNFTVKSHLIDRGSFEGRVIEGHKVKLQEVKNLEIQNVRKVPDPDGVSDWKLKRYRDQPTVKVQ